MCVDLKIRMAIGLSLLLASVGASANVIYDWTGTCDTSCTTATGELTLVNAGPTASKSDFVSFNFLFDGNPVNVTDPPDAFEFMLSGPAQLFYADGFGIDFAGSGGGVQPGQWFVGNFADIRFTGPSSFFTLRSPTASVPEPGTLGACMAGLLTLAFLRRKQATA